MSAPAIISSGTSSGGPPVGGTGITNTIPRWTGPSTLGDSGLIDDGSVIYTTARNAAFGSTSSAGYRARVLAAAGAGSAFGLRIDAGTNSTDYALRIANQATTSDYLAVRGDGNVGIGTASPVNHGAGAVTLAVNGTSLSMMDWMVNGTRTMAGFAQAVISQFGTVTSSPLAFLTANQERARIDSSGRWYVGVSSAVSPASGGIWSIINQPGGAGGQEWHNSSASPGGAAIIPSQNRATWYVYQNAVGSETYSQSCAFTSTGIDLTGAATPGLKLPATPGNTDTQTLDCYAEVAWTPADVSGAGLSITVNRATYTKIGRTVTASFDITYPVTANGTAAQISLPESTGTANLGTLSAPYCSVALAAGLTGIVTNGKIVFYYGYPSANVPNSTFSGARIVASVTFTV